MKQTLAIMLLLSVIGCSTQQPTSDAHISAFRAVGQEPGWLLEIYRDHTLRFLYNYGEEEILAPITAFGQSGVQYTYQSHSDAGVFNIEIALGTCYDTMSGEAYTALVILRFNEQTYDGCANPMP